MLEGTRNSASPATTGRKIRRPLARDSRSGAVTVDTERLPQY
jgi:hypothetical protein